MGLWSRRSKGFRGGPLRNRVRKSLRAFHEFRARERSWFLSGRSAARTPPLVSEEARTPPLASEEVLFEPSGLLISLRRPGSLAPPLPRSPQRWLGWVGGEPNSAGANGKRLPQADLRLPQA